MLVDAVFGTSTKMHLCLWEITRSSQLLKVILTISQASHAARLDVETTPATQCRLPECSRSNFA